MNAVKTHSSPILASRTGALVAAAVAASVAGCAGGGGDAAESEGATELFAVQASLALRGTTTAQLEIEANGAWVASADPTWLTVQPTQGEGDATIEVTVDRSGLNVDSYAGVVTLSGAPEAVTSVPVLMTFPEVSGSLDSPGGYLQSRRAESSVPGRDYVAGEILVGLDRQMVAIQEHGHTYGPLDAAAEPSLEAMETAAQNLATQLGAETGELVAPAIGLAKFTVADDDVTAAIERAAVEGVVRYAEPNDLMELHATDDTHYELQWHYESIGLEQAWDVTTGFEEVTVAVIDADFHPDHPDLADNLLTGYDFVRNTTDIHILNEDCNSHGTHVAGTVAAVTNNGLGVAGVAPDVRVLPLNITREDACGLPVDASVRAILYAAGADDPQAGQLAAPVDVINMSFGGSTPRQARGEALQFARDAGVVLVSSSGNGGRDVDPVGFPAARPSVFAIAATDILDDRAPYSSFGPEVWVAAPGGNSEQQIPGEDHSARVLSTAYVYDGDDSRHSYTFKQGTSMASPHAAGVAALMRSANPDLTPFEVGEILAQTAIDLGEPGRNDEFGYGLINAEAAVAAARDNLRIRSDEVIVRLLIGDEVIVETTADSAGGFELGAVKAGDYTLEAGSLRDGELGRPGTVYGQQTVTIDYSGAQSLLVEVDAR